MIANVQFIPAVHVQIGNQCRQFCQQCYRLSHQPKHTCTSMHAYSENVDYTVS